MHSRAHMLLEREFLLMQKNPVWGVEAAAHSDDNFMDWVATIRGLKDTIWEGGVFVLNLKFDEHYNSAPPSVHFHTIPFHPNIDMTTGRPCVDYLDDYNTWKESYRLTTILLTIQCLLSNPVLEAPVNHEACRILIESPDVYRQMVIDCVTASQRVQAGQSLETADTRVRFNDDEEVPAEQPRSSETQRLAKISFDDYLTTWSGIATSKSQSDMKNPLLEAIKNDPKLQTAHFGLPMEELQQHMKHQLHEHNSLMFGNFAPKQEKKDPQETKQDQINKMRRIYLPSRRLAPPPSTAQSETGDPWDKEVDDLVAWTTNLDENALD